MTSTGPLLKANALIEPLKRRITSAEPVSGYLSGVPDVKAHLAFQIVHLIALVEAVGATLPFMKCDWLNVARRCLWGQQKGKICERNTSGGIRTAIVHSFSKNLLDATGTATTKNRTSFTPVQIGNLKLANRIVIAPMAQYPAEGGQMDAS